MLSLSNLAGAIIQVYNQAANHHVAKSRLYLEIGNWIAAMDYAEDLLEAGGQHRATMTQAQHVADLNTSLAVFVIRAGFKFANYRPGTNAKPGKVVDRP